MSITVDYLQELWWDDLVKLDTYGEDLIRLGWQSGIDNLNDVITYSVLIDTYELDEDRVSRWTRSGCPISIIQHLITKYHYQFDNYEDWIYCYCGGFSWYRIQDITHGRRWIIGDFFDMSWGQQMSYQGIPLFKVYHLTGHLAMTVEEGEWLYNIIDKTAEWGYPITLDFQDIVVYSAPFFSEAIGKLYRKYPYDFLDKIQYLNILSAWERLLERVIVNAKEYYSLPLETQKQIDAIFERDSEEW